MINKLYIQPFLTFHGQFGLTFEIEERLQIAHWGPSLLGIGRERSRHLCIGQEAFWGKRIDAMGFPCLTWPFEAPHPGRVFHQEKMGEPDYRKLEKIRE